MRKRAERQLPLDFAGTLRLTQDWYVLYKHIHEILDQNPAVTDLVHTDLTGAQKKLKRNVEGVASESILRMAIVQQIDNHFISPIVMQRAVKLHPAVVMLALLAGGTLGGFFGLLLAVPATAVLKILFGHAWRHYVLGEPLDEIEARWDEEAEHPVHGGFIEPVGVDVDADAAAAPLTT